MKSNTEKNNCLYEKPKFNKYGSMKYLVFGSGGSNGDGMGSDGSDPGLTDSRDADLFVNDQQFTLGDSNGTDPVNTRDNDPVVSDQPDPDFTTTAD